MSTPALGRSAVLGIPMELWCDKAASQKGSLLVQKGGTFLRHAVAWCWAVPPIFLAGGTSVMLDSLFGAVSPRSLANKA